MTIEPFEGYQGGVDTDISVFDCYQYRISTDNGSTWGNWSALYHGTAPINVTLNTQGTNVIQVQAEDHTFYSNNPYVTTSGQYFIDTTPPTVSYSPGSSGYAASTTVTITPGDSGGSGVKQYQYRISTDNGSTWGAWSGAVPGGGATSVTLNTQGTDLIQTQVTDNAGNTATATSGQYLIENIISVTHPISVNYTINPNSSTPFSCSDIPVKNNMQHMNLKVFLQSFSSANGGALKLNDVSPEKYQDWNKLTCSETKSDIAMAAQVKETAISAASWSEIDRNMPLYAATLQAPAQFGILSPGGTGNISLSAKCGLAWDRNYTADEQLTFRFEIH